MQGILIINKERGFTSRDCVNIISKEFHTKRVGHTGTLDPMAEGVLVVCIGNTTKLCELLTSEYKEYIATIKLGMQTDTMDITGAIIEKKDFSITKEQIEKVLSSFLGNSIQEVPIYSAVKVNGKKLYEYARLGKEVPLPKREIHIKDISLLSFLEDEITFKTIVSKGTYIRSLIRDICLKLNTVGTMSRLIRTKQGLFSLEDAYTLEEIKKNQYKMITKEEALSILETIKIDGSFYKKIKDGQIIEKNFLGEMVCFQYKGEIVAIYKTYAKDRTKAKPYKMFTHE